MDQFIAFGIVGLTTAAIYAIIGSGLVLTYTTTGVFNFCARRAGNAGGVHLLAAHRRLGPAGLRSPWPWCCWSWPRCSGWPSNWMVRPCPTAGRGGMAAGGDGRAAERPHLAVAFRRILGPQLCRARCRPFFADREPFRFGSAIDHRRQAITMAVAVVVAVVLRIVLYSTRTGAEMRRHGRRPGRWSDSPVPTRCGPTASRGSWAPNSPPWAAS
ncbi:hypothetical protein ACU686_28090 [Yinghuangia aomiensis]